VDAACESGCRVFKIKARPFRQRTCRNRAPLITIYGLQPRPVWHSTCRNAGMPHRILIIDDDDQLATAYQEYLSAQGHQVDCAQELEEAQALLTHFSYAVVITDLRLNKLGFGGLNVIKYIRELALKTRIIVFTGYGWPELRAEASAHGVDAFFRKPAQLAALAQTVSELAGVQA